MQDKSKYTPMIQQYLELKEENPGMLLFFRLGDFYELFFEDALKASKMLEITLTSRGGGPSEKIPMCGVPYHAAHTYIQKIIDQGEKVAIAEQTSEPGKGVTLVKREVIKIITPGTYVQEGMFEASDNSYVCSVVKNDETFDVSYGDISIGKYYYMNGLKNAHEVFDLIQIISPIEVVVKTLDTPYLSEVVNATNALFTKIDEITQTNNKLIPADAVEVFSVLETYLLSVRADSMDSFQEMTKQSYTQSMYLSSASSSSLELFETIKTRKKEGSLLSLLDETKTAIGARMLRNWLEKPLMDYDEIRLRQTVVSFFVEHYIDRLDVQKSLGKIYDLERLISRVVTETAAVRELHQLKQSLLAVSELEAFVAKETTHPLIKEKFASSSDVHFVRDELNRALATEDITSVKDTGIFNPGYSQELDELKAIAQGGTEWLIDLEARERERTGIKNLRIKYNKVFGYFIEISKGNIHLVQDEWGYERKQTLTNAERYITEELKQKEEQILSSHERLSHLEDQLFLELCQKIFPYREALQKLADSISWLDVLQSFATVSQENNYIQPQVSNDQSVELIASRHPVIEQVVGKDFVPNDLNMNHESVLLITGPNMAGKSTYMRQIAICAIMHQVGCFIPAEQAKIPIFDALFTRIGAQDDLFSGESTFMVEMKEVSQALEKATEKSLLLFDEIGRGTATYDGLALAYAILNYIVTKIGAKTLFSTHYHELTEFADKLEDVRNVYVSATIDDDNIIFHHKVYEGSIERSYGVHVAGLAKLPESVIEEAKRLLIVLESSGASVDGALVEDGHVNQVVSLQNTIDEKEQQNIATRQYIEQVAKLDLNDLSPRDAWDKLEELQRLAKKF